MDRQVSNKNKSDGRDYLQGCFIAGKVAFRICFVGPIKLTGLALQHFIFGWMEEKDKNNKE